MSLKQVAIVLDDASQYERLLEALDTATKCSLNPKEQTDFRGIKNTVERQNICFDRGYQHVLGRITDIVIKSTISKISSHENNEQG